MEKAWRQNGNNIDAKWRHSGDTMERRKQKERQRGDKIETTLRQKWRQH